MKYMVLALSVLLCMVPLARGKEVILDCIQDAEVDEEEPDVNKGGGADIMIGATWGEPEIFRAYGLFEFEGLMTYPENDIIVNEAILTLFIVSNDNEAEANIYTAGDEWNEMSVTWNSRPAENRDIVVTDTAPPLEPPVQPWEIDVTEIVRTWYEPYPPEHYGLYIDIPDNGMTVDIDIASKDHFDTLIHPRLWVDADIVDISEDTETDVITFDVSQVSQGCAEICFSLPAPTEAMLKVYDASGSLVATLAEGVRASGSHILTWSGDAGIYLVRLEVNGNALTRKAVILE